MCTYKRQDSVTLMIAATPLPFGTGIPCRIAGVETHLLRSATLLRRPLLNRKQPASRRQTLEASLRPAATGYEF